MIFKGVWTPYPPLWIRAWNAKHSIIKGTLYSTSKINIDITFYFQILECTRHTRNHPKTVPEVPHNLIPRPQLREQHVPTVGRHSPLSMPLLYTSAFIPERNHFSATFVRSSSRRRDTWKGTRFVCI